jgi:hypothetical protein
MRYYRGVQPFSEPELDAWCRALHERRDWLAQRNIGYLVVVVPDKQSVYPEHLPPTINRVRTTSRLDQLLDRLNREVDPLVVDLRAALTAGKKQRLTYFQTDSHWNSYGAWIGYREIIRALQTSIPDLSPADLDDFMIVSKDSPGDLAILLQRPNMPEAGNLQLQAKLPQSGSSKATINTVSLRGLDDKEQGNTAIVIHDSFAWALQPFLNRHWDRVTYVPDEPERWNFPTELIEREGPVVVIHEFVDRKLMSMVLTNPPLPAIRPSERPDVSGATANRPSTIERR